MNQVKCGIVTLHAKLSGAVYVIDPVCLCVCLFVGLSHLAVQCSAVHVVSVLSVCLSVTLSNSIQQQQQPV